MDTMKSHILRCLVFVGCLMVLTFSVSYSFFNLGVNKIGEPDKETTIYAANMKITFSSTQYINVDKMLLTKSTEVDTKAPYTEFKIGHAEGSTAAAQYFIYISDIDISNQFKSNDFKWKLSKVVGESEEEVINGNFANIGDANSLLLKSEATELPKGSTVTYRLRLWLEETDQDQSSLYNGHFKGKVQVVASV